MKKIIQKIAAELAVSDPQVDAAVGLLDEGATVPFIARYRKERTGGLDDVQLRALEERLGYLRELEARREVILRSIEEQGKMSDGLKRDLLEAETKTRLEDLYLPYRPKRRTKAQIAREAGLEPLALRLLAEPDRDPEAEAAPFVDADKGVEDVKAALDGARQILMERFSEDAELLGGLREYLWENATVNSAVVAGKEREAAKFADYFEYAEAIRKIPSHRALALFRGRNEGVLNLDLVVDESAEGVSPCELTISRHVGVEARGRPADAWLRECVRWAWRVKIFTHLDLELKMRLREAAEAEAIRVFASNLKDLLLAAPAGNRAIIGLDPGLRTGVKVAVVDGTGKVLDTATIYPHAPRKDWDRSLAVLAALAGRHRAGLVSIGNGTASRETDRLAADLIKRHPGLKLQKIVVSEAGASVYSASELASAELPELDVSLRGAVSIARRLQDPLAELVKIEPKSIGVGQYQHDVNQSRLGRTLENVVEDCVNSVGVDVNTASPALLGQVAGLSRALADNIVQYRNANGAFRRREQLLEVPRLGAKTYEQAVGFLRIPDGENPLDASAVHPEAYPVVQRILDAAGRRVADLIGDVGYLKGLDPARFTDQRFGVPTVSDIIAELEKPGRDPRGEFRTATFQEGVEEIADLKPDMVLEGVVTNVTNFGAFVDVGVHQDGLVHISALSEKFVKDPREVVKTGDMVRVKVMAVDLERRRIALSMRLGDRGEGRPDASPRARGGPSRADREHRPAASERRRDRSPRQGAMAAALANALGDGAGND
ncbi:MAG: RNA-binding transcriptional accessory protein [Candidatus Sedimenticola endophacoides]|uniref:RNA-binding transcriptional accessory protein n=1 Tax=Candidatus Sedimenticola endophacoides TaxID=2548426 RepID=A0A6N4DYH9_9GAMM|nr:MAG: RNA-binding transcriptional accessory protein [Candidatus Sedimenticola endophacoides]OQX36505.1 MAG: RNA-binding transcriptional accessory protein [Candidatus Sedimenticola endophacoides]OQX40939.1 MAG: RNA-binding transcriptional accessory protein [Candidatus Sedimenticola endophacoides]PUE01841.1 MAG: RNA-binding transcriptional accessory protein [Candidatus Sedimenticola endophacoides]PUE03579.1 MAG: RNA-binding transcriptional accessory protein [Candidatus Sedimenticola endophacoid